jgi:hypothetical protein
MPFNRTRIAAASTLAALGVLAAVALSAGGKPSPAQPAATPKPEVRTEVIRRTVHVSRKHSKSAPGPARASSVRPTAPAAQPRAAAPATPARAPSAASYDGDDRSGHGGGEDHDDQGDDGGDDD